jgi:hypothetical protein
MLQRNMVSWFVALYYVEASKRSFAARMNFLDTEAYACGRKKSLIKNF